MNLWDLSLYKSKLDSTRTKGEVEGLSCQQVLIWQIYVSCRKLICNTKESDHLKFFPQDQNHKGGQP